MPAEHSEPSVLSRVRAALDASVDAVGHALGAFDRLLLDARCATETARATPRFARVLGEATLTIEAYRLHRAWACHVPPQAAARRLERLHADMGTRLYRASVDLGGAVLKVGQAASCRRDLLPGVLVDALVPLQDRVPAEPFSAILPVLRTDIPDLDAALPWIDPEPLAAASLAQVHAARRADGRRVALKIQRPGIAEVVAADLAALRLAATWLQDDIPGLDLAALLAELARSVTAELDYRREAQNLRAMAAALEGDDAVRVPALHPALCGDRVLAMDLVAGERLSEVFADEARRRPVVDLIVRACAAQILLHGVVQCDPHPGNFLVDDADRLVLLDFGNVTILPADVRRGYAQLMAGLAMGQGADHTTACLEAMGFAVRGGGPDGLHRFSEVFLEAFHSAPGSLDLQQSLGRARQALSRGVEVVVPAHFVAVARVLATVGGIVLGACPDIDLLPLVAPVAAAGLSADPG